MPLGQEPTLIIGTILAALNAVQAAVLNMPAWAHTVILVTTILLGAVLNRQVVTPTADTGTNTGV